MQQQTTTSCRLVCRYHQPTLDDSVPETLLIYLASITLPMPLTPIYAPLTLNYGLRLTAAIFVHATQNVSMSLSIWWFELMLCWEVYIGTKIHRPVPFVLSLMSSSKCNCLVIDISATAPVYLFLGSCPGKQLRVTCTWGGERERRIGGKQAGRRRHCRIWQPFFLSLFLLISCSNLKNS